MGPEAAPLQESLEAGSVHLRVPAHLLAPAKPYMIMNS